MKLNLRKKTYSIPSISFLLEFGNDIVATSSMPDWEVPVDLGEILF